jgi:hypothetical protein
MAVMYSVGSGPAPVNTAGIPYATLAPPAAASILNGMASTDGGTILTIPANSTALFTINLSATITSASVTATPTVTMTGTGSPTPATNATLAALALRTNAGQSLANSTLVFNNIYVYSGTSTVAVKLNFGSATAAVAVINGAVIV